MSLLSPWHARVGLSFLIVFLIASRGIETQESIPEVLHHGSCSRVQLHGPRRVLTSPGYPLAYHNYTSCQWYIFAEPDEIITLSFDDLDIEEDSEPCLRPPCCSFSWVKLGPDNEERFCGQVGQGMLLPTAIAKSGPLWIKFHTAMKISGGRGFKLTFVVGMKHMKTCASDEFQCTDQQNCILASWRCNKRFECLDGSDEQNCPKHCTAAQLRCASGNQCYKSSQRCDGYMECADFSDELDCGRCPVNFTACGSSPQACYNPFTSRCNSILDCPSGEDEQGCSSSCLKHQIPCASGIGCYSLDERCSGTAQCSDTSDEKNCRADLCRSDRGGFLCRNGHCIRETWRCDRTNDCGDESDEINCLRNSVIAAAVIGSLVCGLLLIIAISCSCKLYALRQSDPALLPPGVHSTSSGGGSRGRETPLSRLEREFMYREPPPAYAVAVGATAPQPWGDCPPQPSLNGRGPRRHGRCIVPREQHRRISQTIRPNNCGSPVTEESSAASTSSVASSPSAFSAHEDITQVNPPSLGESPLQASTSRKKTSTSAPTWPQEQQQGELKPESEGELNLLEMTTTSDVAPLLP